MKPECRGFSSVLTRTPVDAVVGERTRVYKFGRSATLKKPCIFDDFPSFSMIFYHFRRFSNKIDIIFGFSTIVFGILVKIFRALRARTAFSTPFLISLPEAVWRSVA